MNDGKFRDRIRISDENAPVLEALGDNAAFGAVFKTQAEAVVFSVTVGHYFGYFEPVSVGSSKAILFRQIDNATVLGGDLDAVFGLARVGDISVLSPPEGTDDAGSDRVLIFEGYVNGGLTYLRNTGFDTSEPIEAVLRLVRTLNSKDSSLLRRS